jgi:hypothetical protein
MRDLTRSELGDLHRLVDDVALDADVGTDDEELA